MKNTVETTTKTDGVAECGLDGADVPRVSHLCYAENSGGAVMAKTETIRARVEPALKRETEEVFRKLGLLMSEAFDLFCRKVVMRRGLPFAFEIPNEEMLAAVRRARAREGLVEYGSFEDFREEMGT